jgi:hypothetical protein
LLNVKPMDQCISGIFNSNICARVCARYRSSGTANVREWQRQSSVLCLTKFPSLSVCGAVYFVNNACLTNTRRYYFVFELSSISFHMNREYCLCDSFQPNIIFGLASVSIIGDLTVAHISDSFPSFFFFLMLRVSCIVWQSTCKTNLTCNGIYTQQMHKISYMCRHSLRAVFSSHYSYAVLSKWSDV